MKKKIKADEKLTDAAAQYFAAQQIIDELKRATLNTHDMWAPVGGGMSNPNSGFTKIIPHDGVLGVIKPGFTLRASTPIEPAPVANEGEPDIIGVNKLTGKSFTANLKTAPVAKARDLCPVCGKNAGVCCRYQEEEPLREWWFLSGGLNYRQFVFDNKKDAEAFRNSAYPNETVMHVREVLDEQGDEGSKTNK